MYSSPKNDVAHNYTTYYLTLATHLPKHRDLQVVSADGARVCPVSGPIADTLLFQCLPSPSTSFAINISAIQETEGLLRESNCRLQNLRVARVEIHGKESNVGEGSQVPQAIPNGQFGLPSIVRPVFGLLIWGKAHHEGKTDADL